MAGAVPLALSRLEALQTRPSGMLKIAAVEFVRLEGRREAATGDTGQHQVQPLHVYDDYRPKPYHAGTPATRSIPARALYLKIKTDQGLEGVYGPIDTEAAIVVDQQLRRYLIGKDPLAIEALWDQMYRSNRHSRRGIFMMAISAVDNALWDLRGRYFEAPVYRLLGGPTRPNVEAYASCLGYSVEPEPARARAIEFKKQGYRYQKWFCAYGPGDGAEGLMKNVEMVRVLREAVGPETELMFDAYNGWNLDYAIAWAKQVEQYRPRWIEEAFVSEKIDSFAALRRATSVPVATGEHFYGRWEVNEFLRAGAITVVQADPEWCGGVSELVKICTLASVHGVNVIPHGHSLHAAMHVVASQPVEVCPLVEYLIQKMDTYYDLEKHQPRPVEGVLELPERPGFGIELDESKIEDIRPISWRQSNS